MPELPQIGAALVHIEALVLEFRPAALSAAIELTLCFLDRGVDVAELHAGQVLAGLIQLTVEAGAGLVPERADLLHDRVLVRIVLRFQRRRAGLAGFVPEDSRLDLPAQLFEGWDREHGRYRFAVPSGRVVIWMMVGNVAGSAPGAVLM